MNHFEQKTFAAGLEQLSIQNILFASNPHNCNMTEITFFHFYKNKTFSETMMVSKTKKMYNLPEIIEWAKQKVLNTQREANNTIFAEKNCHTIEIDREILYSLCLTQIANIEFSVSFPKNLNGETQDHEVWETINHFLDNGNNPLETFYKTLNFFTNGIKEVV